MAGKVIVDISTSLDGFVTAAGRTAAEPLGTGGQRLHDWFFAEDDARNRSLAEAAVARLGAVVCGRRTYDDSMPGWGTDGPTGPARVPTVVLTHSAPADVPENAVYTFATDVADALARAREAAGAGDVAIMGGADVIRQFLAAGVVDEVSLHVVPILFGCGTPLLDGAAGLHVDLELVDVVATAAAVHSRYRVAGRA